MSTTLNTLEAKLFISEVSSKVWKEYQQVYNCGDQPPILYEIKAKSGAGFAYYSGKVKYNLAYFCTVEDKQELEQIVAHELAHIVQYRCFPRAKQAHGTEFRTILALAGYKTDTYHRMDVAKAKAATKTLKDQIILVDL